MTITIEESLRRLIYKLGTKTSDQLASTLAQAGDATGVVASGYLPLTGGALTGALSGTTATFSGDITSSGQISNANARLYANGDILGAVVTGNSLVSSTTIAAVGSVTAGNISATPGAAKIPQTPVGSSVLDIGWVPTSTLSVSTAVPLASDPRLSDARPPLAHVHSFGSLTGIPNTLAGYGITTPIASADGGTGVNNAGRTLTVATNSGTLAFGAPASTLTVGATTTISGGGTLALAGFSVTAPASGTLPLLATANTFSTLQTVSSATADFDALKLENTSSSVTPAVKFSWWLTGLTGRPRFEWQAYRASSTAGSEYIRLNHVTDSTFALDLIAANKAGNIGFGTSTWGTNAATVIAIKNGTAPSTSVVDTPQLYAADVVAGNSALHTRTENGAVVKLFQDTGWSAATGTTTKTTFATSTVTLSVLAEHVKALTDALISNGLLGA